MSLANVATVAWKKKHQEIGEEIGEDEQKGKVILNGSVNSLFFPL